MITIYDLKVLFYLTFILLICILPILVFRKNWKETSIVTCVIIYFFILNKDIIWGKLGAYHDTKFTYENILIVFKQWLDVNMPIGWNPYMNGGEPLYLFSNHFLRAPWVLFCWINKFINLNPHTLFNLFWVFLFVNFSIGSLLLFLVLYDDFRVSLFCFITLMISGMFIVNLGQPAGLTIMYYFPYILFCIVLACKRKNIYGVVFATIFLGIAMNYYLPHYIVLTVGIFVLFIFPFLLKQLPSGLSLLKSNYKIILPALVIFLLAVSPALLLYIEMQGYVSPTRGGLLAAGALKFGQTGSQPHVNAPLWGYRILLEQSIPYIENLHHAFYIGILPLLLTPLALFRWRDKYFWSILLGSIVVLFLSTGYDFWGYRLLIRYIPTFNIIRHSFGLAHFVSFLLICISGFGLKELLRDNSNIIRNFISATLVIISFIIASLILYKLNIILLGSLVILTLIFLVIVRQLSSNRINNFITKQLYLLIILLLFIDLTLFYTHNYKINISEERLALNKPFATPADITYPRQRIFFPTISYPLPMDISPLILKKASLTHPDANYTLFRNHYLNDMLRLFVPETGYEQALGVNYPIIYFTQNTKVFSKDVSKEQFIGSIFADAAIHKQTYNRSVFFSEKDIDFYDVNNHPKNLQEATIEYTKIDNPNALEITVDTPSDGFLVRLENFHPGWKAFIDGSKASIYRANYAFQTIRVLKGKHKVVFRFVSIYPFLFYLHIVCVFLNWVAFNFSLFKLGKN